MLVAAVPVTFKYAVSIPAEKVEVAEPRAVKVPSTLKARVAVALAPKVEEPVARRFEMVESPVAVRLPVFVWVAARLVELAVVAKRLVAVALVVVF